MHRPFKAKERIIDFLKECQSHRKSQHRFKKKAVNAAKVVESGGKGRPSRIHITGQVFFDCSIFTGVSFHSIVSFTPFKVFFPPLRDRYLAFWSECDIVSAAQCTWLILRFCFDIKRPLCLSVFYHWSYLFIHQQSANFPFSHFETIHFHYHNSSEFSCYQGG